MSWSPEQETTKATFQITLLFLQKQWPHSHRDMKCSDSRHSACSCKSLLGVGVGEPMPFSMVPMIKEKTKNHTAFTATPIPTTSLSVTAN